MVIDSISPSQLDLYNSCPYCFYLKKLNVEQPEIEALRFGTGVHEALEKYHKEECVETEPEFQDYLDEYMEMYTPEFEVCEERFYLPLFDTGIEFTFKMDLIKDDWIIDHKTSSGRYTQEQVDLHRQGTGYWWAFVQKYGRQPQGLRFNVFNKKVKKERLQILDTFRTEEDLWEWEAWVKRLLNDIKEDKFEPKASLWHIYQLCPMNKR